MTLDERRAPIAQYEAGVDEVPRAPDGLPAGRQAGPATTPLPDSMTGAARGDADWRTDAGAHATGRWLEIDAAHAHGHAAQLRRLREAAGR